MTAPTRSVPLTGGEGSAQPGRRQRRPRAKRKPDHRYLLQVTPEGSFRAADLSSSKKLRAAGFQKHQPVIAYLYRVRDPVQWRKAHVLGDMLAQNHERFAGMKAHDVLKALQLEANVACRDAVHEVTLLDEEGQPNGTATRTVREAESLEFGNLDDGEWQMVWKGLCRQAGTYFGDIDADAVEHMLQLMPTDPA